MTLENIYNITAKMTLENIYYITAGPLLLVVATFALWQIKVTKDSTKIQSKREAIRLAIEQSAIFAKDILEQYCTKFHAQASNNGYKTYAKTKTNTFYSQDLDIQYVNDNINSINKCLREAIELLNSMEAFAMHFTSLAADEEVAFRPIAVTFCDEVEKMYPYICLQRDSRKATNYYENLVELYINWKNKIEKRELEKQEEELKKNLQRIKSESPHMQRPIGTN